MGIDPGHGGWVPAACTLPSADTPVRVMEFDTLFADAVHGLERVAPQRLRFALTPSPQVAARAAELATRETDCCSFFTFTLTATGGTLWLEATVPNGQTAVLDGLVARAVAATGSAS